MYARIFSHFSRNVTVPPGLKSPSKMDFHITSARSSAARTLSLRTENIQNSFEILSCKSNPERTLYLSFGYKPRPQEKCIRQQLPHATMSTSLTNPATLGKNQIFQWRAIILLEFCEIHFFRVKIPSLFLVKKSEFRKIRSKFLLEKSEFREI